MIAKEPIIKIDEVSYSYNGQPALEDISLDIYERDFLGIIGPNGGGKTTLLKLLLGLYKPTKGSINIMGQPCARMRHIIGYVPQHAIFDPDFPVNVRDVVLMGRLSHSRLFRRFSREDKDAAREAMEKVDIISLQRRQIGELSGGERQRALIARALAGNPRILILDEPTANVDTRVEKGVYELLRKLNQSITIILVSHDLGFISNYINKLACISRRLACHPSEKITPELIERLYQAPVGMVRHEHRLHDDSRPTKEK